jgi:hypothetical protein
VSARFSCLDDLRAAAAPDLGPILGSWRNADPRARGLAGIEVAGDGRQPRLRVTGAGEVGPGDWGWAPARAFACREEDDVESVSLLAAYDLGDAEVELQLRVNKGILAVTRFSRFRDGSGRSDYVVRELFRRRA